MKYLLGLIFIVSLSAQAAVKIGQDFPYIIFNVGDDIYFCIPPAKDELKAQCWTEGKRLLCEVLSPKDGYFKNCISTPFEKK